jgi:hypothetical protein
MTMLAPNDLEAQRKRIIKSRNRVVALLLLGMVVLFFAITIVQFGD